TFKGVGQRLTAQGSRPTSNQLLCHRFFHGRNDAQDVLGLLELFERNDIAVWVDGGWGVDALLGEVTRPHGDLDIVIDERDLATTREVLVGEGFTVVIRDYRPWNFVMAHPDGREVDLHVVVFDDRGDGIYGPEFRGERYPAAALTGRGVIGGRRVRCISAEWQVRFHTGYEWDDNDRVDMEALCARFGFEMPGDPTIPRWKS
ncbi:MAG: nucleotidyltransferase domain-containing protein, partial [Actinomycetota bacterium]